MRRSAAPSVRQINSSLSSNTNVSPITKSANITRDTSSILGLLTKSPECLQCSTENENCEIDKVQIAETSSFLNNDCNKKIFTIVWGKKSTKKHKTWEGDGTLEVNGNSATLKDEDGKFLGKATNLKPNIFEDGAILSIGSKSVQIIELQTSVNCQKSKDSQEKQVSLEKKNTQGIKRKISTGNNFTNPFTSTKRKITENCNSIILPHPPHEHQWEHNVNKLPIVEVAIDSFLTKILRPHQVDGIVFLYRSVLGFNGSYYGAILADEMGLGKTIQSISLIWTLLKQGPYGGRPVLHKVLIITPSSLVANWEKEFYRWLTKERIKIFIVDSKNKPKDFAILNHIPIMVISYEMFVRYYSDIKDILFDMIICDEGHRLKNSTIKVTTLINQMDCKRRIILTGTPIQNDLQEFYSLVSFVNPGVLGTLSEYRRYYEEPIVASRLPDVDEDAKYFGEKRAFELNEKTSYFILRRTQEIIDKYLPTKQEVVLFCRISKNQFELYKEAVEFWENRKEFDENVSFLAVLTVLKKICNHPSLLDSRENEDDNSNTSLMQHLRPLLSDKMSIEDSTKLNIVDGILSSLAKKNEKIILVSYFTQTLDLLGNLCDYRQYKYCRLDGATPTNQRLRIVDKFNVAESKDFVFLLSAKAGGVGLNLTGASRLLLYDSDWNPATDLQAMSRIWRDGQKKSVYLYRLLTTGSIEEKIFQRQILKTGLSSAVVDSYSKETIKFSTEELKSLMSLQFDIDTCLTHESFKCNCNYGKLSTHKLNSESIKNPVDNRDCQLGIAISEKQNLTMNELMHWEHHGVPFNEDLIDDLCLNNVINDITYIFRNKIIC